jgi:outer membrane protein/protease secretion system outer membrane protein
VRQALDQQDRAEHAIEAARRDLSARVTREWRAVSEGQARIGAFEQAVRSAQQLVHATQQSFQAGIRSNLDVLDAQDRLVTARIELARARYLMLVASLRLAVLAGTANEALLADINRQLDQPLALGLQVPARH